MYFSYLRADNGCKHKQGGFNLPLHYVKNYLDGKQIGLICLIYLVLADRVLTACALKS